MMKVICILSDALRYDYIRYMPFLNGMKDKSFYVESIIPSIGFCEISEYVSGKDSLSNGNIFQINFKGDFSVYKKDFFGMFYDKLKTIPRTGRISNVLFDVYRRKFLNSLDESILRVRYEIPISLLKYFYPVESNYEYDDIKFMGKENLFIKLKNKCISYDIRDFVKHNKIYGHDIDRLKRILAKIQNKNLKDFTLIYIGYGEIAHQTGTQSEKFHNVLREYDEKLKILYDELKRKYENNFRFVILGDHGMIDVKKYIDIKSFLEILLKKYSLRIGENIVYFIDSTILRIWVSNVKYKSLLKEKCSGFLKEDMDSYSFENKSFSKYGDIIFMLKPGRVFYPDFFNRKKVKGMHGYSNLLKEQYGTMMILGDMNNRNVEKMDLFKVKHLIENFYF